ncbi:MAG: hypothetical protein FWG55_05960 [Candidatus Bathyarchaeota archaeon]|nr:hypothetical protein [Candidatus Termiticorpusculum sp.]
MAITRVQTPKRNYAANSSTLNVTLNNAPANGNVLVAVIGTFASTPPSVSSIAQASGGVTWTRQNYSSDSALYGRRVEIWTGIVAGTVSPTLTITLSANADPVIANVAEYSGLTTSNILDTMASSIGAYTTTLTTGTTPTTSQADELWIGGIINVINPTSGAGITSPTNSFTLHDGSGYVGGLTVALAYLDRIVSATGAAYTGATGASGATYSAYAGCIVTLKGGTGGGGGGPDLHVTGSLTVDGTTTLKDQTILPCVQPILTRQQLIDCLWRFDGANWAPYPLPYPKPLPDSRITFIDTVDSAKTLNLMEIIVDAGVEGKDPLLATDVGLIVKKDISCGGFVSSNQGELWLGHGRNDRYDVPKIILSHANAAYYGSAYDTLYLRKANTNGVNDPAHLDLQNLTAHGNITASNLTATGITAVTFTATGSVNPDVSPTWNGSSWVNGKALGSTSKFWNYIDCAYYFAKNTSFIAFDSVDDLSLAKNYKTKQAGDREVIDFESLPHLKPDDPEHTDSVDMTKTAGFMLGCIKALVQRVEALEKQLEKKK